MSTKSQVCTFCNVGFTDEYDIDRICSNKDDAADCFFSPSKRPKFALKAVGDDFVKPEDNPQTVEAMQTLINDGGAWHPDIDQDGSIGRSANDFINRENAKKMRHMFEVAQRFDIPRSA